MQGPPTYRVYSAADLKSIAPATLRTAPAPRKSGFFGFGFVLMVTALIGGATFAAQHYLDVKGAEKATAGGSPFSMTLAAPASPPASPLSPPAAPPLLTAADAGTSAPEAVAAATPASRLRRKMIHRRAASASAPLPPPPDPNALPGVPGFVAPAPPATLPPNPF